MKVEFISDMRIFATWRKSSYSGSENGACLEVADGFSRAVPVRDSTRPDGPALVVPAAAWSTFIEHVKRH